MPTLTPGRVAAVTGLVVAIVVSVVAILGMRTAAQAMAVESASKTATVVARSLNGAAPEDTADVVTTVLERQKLGKDDRWKTDATIGVHRVDIEVRFSRLFVSAAASVTETAAGEWVVDGLD